MNKCPKCDLNYIFNPDDTVCEICKKSEYQKTYSDNDNNKSAVEKDLLPFLRKLSQEQLNKLTEKEFSFQLWNLRLPLLVKCRDMGKEKCKEEVTVDKSLTYRYYIKPYSINGELYHICSQWADCLGNKSKSILALMKEIHLGD